MGTLMGICCYLVSIAPSTINFFTLLVGLIFFTVGFIDTQAEGLTAVITKMEARLSELKKEIGIQEEVNSNENIGNFLMLRSFVRYTGIFAGGVLSEQLSIGTIYIILGVFPIFLIVYTIFFFHEIKVKFFLFLGRGNLGWLWGFG